MSYDKIPQEAIDAIAQHINYRNNRQYGITPITIPSNPETPQYFEIVSFDKIDDIDMRVYAIDGSQNSHTFYNGLSIALYCAGYVCFESGKQIRMNNHDNPVILGKIYSPQNILISCEDHLYAIYDELLELPPVRSLINFLGDDSEDIFAYARDTIATASISTLLSFCQAVLEWALIFEIAYRDEIRRGDLILRDGTLRSLYIKQPYLVRLGKLLREKGIIIAAITKNSPIKMELGYTFRQIDNYLQEQLKSVYPFKQKDPKRRKLCCWFEVPDAILATAYGRSGNMFVRKALHGGRGFGLFFAARLDYVEKLQNYDWVIVDVSLLDAIPSIENKNMERDTSFLNELFYHLTRFTQEHYILGYPYLLVEAHNLVTLSSDLKDEVINRVKHSMYANQRMDNVDIENLFLDIHTRF
jgi:hypothetical protein